MGQTIEVPAEDLLEIAERLANFSALLIRVGGESLGDEQEACDLLLRKPYFAEALKCSSRSSRSP